MTVVVITTIAEVEPFLGRASRFSVETEGELAMAMPQRDDLIEEIKRTDLLLEWAVQHGDEAEAERLREKLRKLTEM
jgi:hypothetical protein